jgi:DNA-binding GntR family transcriptional regulator
LYKIFKRKNGGPMSLDVIERPSLPETVYRELRDAIMSGVFSPGQMLRQEEIARRFGVSRAPLREALPRLEAEGLVLLHPRRGYAVVSLDPAEIKEIFELRAMVEQEAARIAARNRSREDVLQACSLQEQLSAVVDVGDRAEISKWFDLHSKFHATLITPSGRRHFVRVAEGLRNIVQSYIRVEILLTGGLAQSHKEHAALAQAFAVGDGDLLALLTRRHCEHTAARLLDGLKRKRPLGQCELPSA